VAAIPELMEKGVISESGKACTRLACSLLNFIPIQRTSPRRSTMFLPSWRSVKQRV
jgi:hypothetical protein